MGLCHESHTGTLTKLALGLLGQTKPAAHEPPASLAPRLPRPEPSLLGGLPLMQALSKRQSQHSFSEAALHEPILSLELAEETSPTGGHSHPVHRTNTK
jgi:hypothetical protein